MTDVLLGAVVVLACLGLLVVGWFARSGRLSARWLGLLAALCSLALLFMLFSDWPSEVLAQFWADHSIVAGVLSTVLMLGIGYLLFEVWDVHEQDRLDRNLTAAGMGGMVDHLVDVEVSLGIIVGSQPPDELGWPAWRTGRPLAWLRHDRRRLSRETDGGPQSTDPRSIHDHALTPGAAVDWRTELSDQAVRRLLAAIRDWTPVIGRSRLGLAALISTAQIRNSLMLLENHLERGELIEADRLSAALRYRCRVLAHALESASLETDVSGLGPSLRAEVLLSLRPLAVEPDRVRAGLRPADEWSLKLRQSAETLRRC